MQYTISKTIKKDVPPEQVFEALREKLRTAGVISDAGGALVVSGFNRNVSGINYLATARFTVRNKQGKTVVTADVRQRPSVPFFILLALTALSFFLMIVPIFFYFNGKNVTRAIERGLDETAEELE